MVGVGVGWEREREGEVVRAEVGWRVSSRGS